MTSNREHGFSMVETMITLSLIGLSLMVLAGGLLGSTRLAADSHRTELLKASIRNVTEALRSTEFSSIPTEFSAANDRRFFFALADGTFAFSNVVPSEAVVAGRLLFATTENDIPPQFPSLGSSFDLDADGTIELNAVTDFKVLPVIIEARIDRMVGVSAIEVAFVLSEEGIK